MILTSDFCYLNDNKKYSNNYEEQALINFIDNLGFDIQLIEHDKSIIIKKPNDTYMKYRILMQIKQESFS